MSTKGKVLKFSVWVKNKYTNLVYEDNKVGEVLREIIWGASFPKKGAYNEIMRYYKQTRKDKETIKTFQDLWCNYGKYVETILSLSALKGLTYVYDDTGLVNGLYTDEAVITEGASVEITLLTKEVVRGTLFRITEDYLELQLNEDIEYGIEWYLVPCNMLKYIELIEFSQEELYIG